MDQQEMVFDTLEPIRVKITFKDTGKRYVIETADEATSARYDDAKLKGAKFSKDGAVLEHGDLNEARAVLLAGCLKEVYTVGENGSQVDKFRPVSPAWVKALPAPVSGPIFDKAKEISRIDEAVTEDFLVKQIARLQRQLDELRGAKEREKNS